MGIRGTVRRSTDNWFVHCNVGQLRVLWSRYLTIDSGTDTDVMIYESDPSDPMLKPPETYTLIENFCLGLRRLEIFGRARTLRRGWVTALAEGEEESVSVQSQGDALGQDEVMDDEVDKPVRWNRESWEAKVRELVPPGAAKLVVPMSSGNSHVVPIGVILESDIVVLQRLMLYDRSLPYGVKQATSRTLEPHHRTWG